MSAKIIPFPRFMQRNLTLSRRRNAAQVAGQLHEWDTADGIHLVGTAVPETPGVSAETYRESQEDAFRIVQEVQQEWHDRHRAAPPVEGERSSRFWATLPMPEPRRETPLAVARRLMHMLLSTAETA